VKKLAKAGKSRVKMRVGRKEREAYVMAEGTLLAKMRAIKGENEWRAYYFVLTWTRGHRSITCSICGRQGFVFARVRAPRATEIPD
jgi:hypothetical protein